MRVKMVGDVEPSYSEYTCYTGIAGEMKRSLSEICHREMAETVAGAFSDLFSVPCSFADFTPADIDTTAYRVFLGNNQYFVSSDVGEGKTQW